MFDALWKALLPTVLAALTAQGCLVGTGALATTALVGCNMNAEPMERMANTMVNEVVKPAVIKIVEETGTQTAALQGAGALISPGYEIKGHAIFGSGISWDMTIQLTGASATLTGATQTSAPGPTTQPAVKP